MSRRRARELALRILYWYEQGNGELPAIMNKVLDAKKFSEEDKKFTVRLVDAVVDNLARIDREIIKVLKNWQFDRVSLIDKLLLRIGTCEILYFFDIPFEVSINEAIEISKKYGDANTPKFINGILDAIASASHREKNSKKKK